MPERSNEPANDSPAANTSTAVQDAPSKPKQLPNWHVVLLNDDDHTYEYVIHMLGELFAHPVERAFQLAKEVDTQGRVICLTTHKELAELKRDQIHAFGKDILLSRSKGSMSATIVPAE